MSIKLSINSDYKNDTGYPFTDFLHIAEAGFTHIHWCHHWNTDFLYSAPEIIEVKRQLKKYKLQLSDAHGSSGAEKCWYSPMEYERLSGVELVKNRIYMTAILGGDAVVIHPFVVYDKSAVKEYRTQGLKSLEELEKFASSCGIKIALENLFQADGSGINDVELENIDTLEYYFSKFSPETIGFCWDIGHCIILGEKAFERCERFAKERLTVMHINDNKGDFDQHSAPFTWYGEWERIAEVIALSPYPKEKPVLLEVDMKKNSFSSDKDFLNRCFTAGEKFSSMI